LYLQTLGLEISLGTVGCQISGFTKTFLEIMGNHQKNIFVAIMFKKKKMKALLKTYTFRTKKLKRYEMV
jgi:hypothetical protein